MSKHIGKKKVVDSELYNGYVIRTIRPGYVMANQGFANFGPGQTVEEIKKRLDDHELAVSKGGGAP